MVFSHRCLPLSVNLREVKASGNRLSSSEINLQYKNLLNGLQGIYRGDGVAPGLDEAWDYSYESLFHVSFGPKRSSRLDRMKPDIIVDILRTRTFWYSRLKPNCVRMVNQLVRGGRLLELKEILHTCDGVMISIMTAFPEVLQPSFSEKPYDRADRIMNNIISNGLMNYKLLIQSVKKFRKTLKKNAFEKKQFFPGNEFRHLSWTSHICDVYNKIYNTNSRSKMLRIGIFCQARACGLGNQSMVEETIDQFLETVTTKQEFSPSDLLVESRDEVVKDIMQTSNFGPSPHFRISMSTSGSVEGPRSKDGKFGYLSREIREGKWDIPASYSVLNQGGELGSPIWQEALHMARNRDDRLLKVNVAGIRENGKVRIVTSGSFYKDALLQPLSHVTIEMLKSQQQVADGLKAGRLGYEFSKRMSTDQSDEFGEIFFAKDQVFFSCDYEKATDNPTHESGRFVMEPLLKEMGFDDEDIQAFMFAWVGEYNLFRNGKSIGTMVNGIPMGNPLTKTNITIGHLICSKYASKKIISLQSSGTLPPTNWDLGRTQSVKVSNGDDLAMVVWGQFKYEYIEYYLEAAASLGYKISDLDTFTTPDWGTYCEEYMRIPKCRFDNVKLATRTKDSKLSPYLDVPKVRLLIDTKKDRQDFSSEPEGKYTLLGKELEYVRKEGFGENQTIFRLSSRLQDVALGLRHFKKPVYLPHQLFSIGKLPMWDADDWSNAVCSMDHPWVKKFTHEVIREMIGKSSPSLTKMRAGRNSDKHFKSEAVIEVMTIPDDDPIKKYKILSHDQWDLFPAGVIEALVASGDLVRESQITPKYLFHQRIRSLSEDLKESDLLEKAKTIVVSLPDFEPEGFKSDAKEFIFKYGKSPWELRRSFREDLYPGTIVEELANADPLRVDIDLPFLKVYFSKKRRDPTTPYERSQRDLFNWFTENLETILAGGTPEDVPRDIIEDDDAIYRSVLHRQFSVNVFIIVTDDKKLCRRLDSNVDRRNNSVMFFRISPHDWVHQSADESFLKEQVTKALGTDNIELIIDNGSLETFMEKTGSNYSLGTPKIAFEGPGWSENIEDVKLPSSYMELVAAYHKCIGEGLPSFVLRSMKQDFLPRYRQINLSRHSSYSWTK